MFNFFLGLLFGGFIGGMTMAICSVSSKRAMCETCPQHETAGQWIERMREEAKLRALAGEGQKIMDETRRLKEEEADHED